MLPDETGLLIWISGPPAAGKSSLADELVLRFDRAIVIPVDHIREWVKSGAAAPVPWTQETERQYRLGEEAACDVAVRYIGGGFTAIIDACRSPKRVDELLEECAPGIRTLKILLRPELSENFRRAHTRTGKDFDPHYLDQIIDHTHKGYVRDLPASWIPIDNTRLTIAEEFEEILRAIDTRTAEKS